MSNFTLYWMKAATAGTCHKANKYLNLFGEYASLTDSNVTSVIVSALPHSPPAASSAPQPHCLSRRIWVGAITEALLASPFYFPEALSTVAHHNWALIPDNALCGFSGSRKLITAINCKHQQSVPGPTISPRLRGPQSAESGQKADQQAVAEFTTSRLSITLTAQ